MNVNSVARTVLRVPIKAVAVFLDTVLAGVLFGIFAAVFVLPVALLIGLLAWLFMSVLEGGAFGGNVSILVWAAYGGAGISLAAGYIFGVWMVFDDSPESYDCVECGHNLDFHVGDYEDEWEDDEAACLGDLDTDECDCDGWVSGPTSRGFVLSSW